MSQTVMNHVGLRRELRMRAMTNELRHRESARADVLVEGSIRQRPFRRNEVDVRLALHTFAERAQLRDLGLRNREVALRGEIDLTRVAHVQLVQFRADLTPDTCLFAGVFDEGRTKTLEAM